MLRNGDTVTAFANVTTTPGNHGLAPYNNRNRVNTMITLYPARNRQITAEAIPEFVHIRPCFFPRWPWPLPP